ncbi:MAG: Probable poly(beta-D-mannuronate) O-acetylase, partial [uncultured Frankineae bacterium]
PRDRQAAARDRPRQAGRLRGGLPALRPRPDQEGRRRRRAVAGGRRGLRPARGPAHDLGGVARRAGLHAADLLRLLRLLRHGDRARPHDRLPAARELLPSVLRGVGHRLLAPLAHVAVALVPRLRLHPARRQPRLVAADLPQPVHGVPAHRDLARRRVDLRGVGLVPRRPARDRAGHRPGPDRGRRLGRPTARGDVPARRRRLGLLPGGRPRPRARHGPHHVRAPGRCGAQRGDDGPHRPAHPGLRAGAARRAAAEGPGDGQTGRREPHPHRGGGPAGLLRGRRAVRRGAGRRRHLQPVPVLPVL